MHATMERRPSAHPAFLQRKCGCGGTCGGCGDKQKKPLHRAAAGAPAQAGIPPIVGDALRSPGQPLAPETRSMMEARFGRDFSGVRVHTGSLAAASASAVHARAYTVGSDIVFNRGMHQPQSRTGQRLLAHELTHVVQQAGGVQRSAWGISSPDDATERAADHAADVVMRGGTPSIAPGGAGVLHREPPTAGDNWEGTWAMCKLDFARWGNWSKAIDCCANVDPLGKGCLSDLDKLRKGLPPGSQPGNQGPLPKPQGPLPPIGGPTIPTVRKCFPPEKPTMYGGCCAPGEFLDRLTGSPCTFFPEKKPQPEGPEKPPEPPPAAKPLPGPIEIRFQYDKPSALAPAMTGSVTSEGKAAYDALLKRLGEDATVKVTLIGRASPEGTDPYNYGLGGRRASSVADALIADGIDASRIADGPPVADAKPVRKGVVTTGEKRAKSEADRMVRAVFFR